jgi:lysophospholipase L1-like esterase
MHSGVIAATTWSSSALPGLLADYRFDEGSGTILTDYSGNGNHGALGTSTLTPTWSASGLTFGAGGIASEVSLPASPGSVKYVLALVNQSATDGGTNQPVVVANNSAGPQFWLVDAISGSGIRPLPTGAPAAASMAATYASGFKSQTQCLFTPGEIVSWAVASPADRIYLGSTRTYDSEVVGTGTYGSTIGAASAGSLYLGRMSPFGLFFKGKMTRVLLCSTAPTDQQIAAAVAALRIYGVARGVSVTPYQNTTASRVLITLGDSIAYGAGLADAWTTTMTLAQTYQRWNLGISGGRISAISAALPHRIAPLVSVNSPVSVAVIHAGTNDVGSYTAAQVFSYLQSAVSSCLGLGLKVVVVPMLSRGSLDTQKNAYNALISAWSLPTGVRLVPEVSLPHLVPDSSSNNMTYFQDGVHPTATGRDELGAAIAVEVNAFG